LQNAGKRRYFTQMTKQLKWTHSISLFSLSILAMSVAAVTSQSQLIPDPPLAAPLPARSGARTVTADWLLKTPFRRFDLSVKWLDNSHLIYEVPPIEDKKLTEIEVLDVKTRSRKSLGEGSMPKASPNALWIAFIRGAGNTNRLWLMKSDGSRPRLLTHLKGGLSGYPVYSYDFAWAPDSLQLALYHQSYVPILKREIQPIADQSKTSALAVEQVQSKPSRSVIDIIDVANSHSQQLLSVDALLRNISWFPQGKKLLFMAERNGQNYNQSNDQTWVQSANISDGRIQTLMTIEGLQQGLGPVSSPDGQHVAIAYDAENLLYSFMTSIGLVDTHSTSSPVESIKRLTYELKLFSPQWSNDGHSLYARRDHGPYSQIYRIEVATGASTPITHASLSVTSYSLSPDGLHLAWIGQDAHGTHILRVAKNNGNEAQDLVTIPGSHKDIALSEVHEMDWEVPNYPIRLRGLMILPLNYQSGTRYPLVVDIHGGGAGSSVSMEGSVLLSTPLEWQMWAAKGYVVFVPELRSSASFGSLAITRDELHKHDLVNCDIQDVIAGVDVLVGRGIVDSNRTAVIGHSAGARSANWLTVATHRFSAVVSIEGWADEWLEAGISPLKRITWMYGGSPLLVPENYQKNSSLFHAKGASTPTLFLMGNPELGGVDSHHTVQWLYNALKEQGVETNYVKYSDEGHTFERYSNRRDVFERTMRWIDERTGRK
jgi:dipeptidyl aminopeptidase/acylaminoacyl peptidase